MNILIAPDSFKGTLASQEVCDVVESAIKKRIKNCNITKLPVADGGEGLCSSLHLSVGGKKVLAHTKGPFGEEMIAEYIILDNETAVIEMASCAGLPLVGDAANPMKTTTYGVGMLIYDAVLKGVKNIILGLGGSATNDCGIGMAKALGFTFLDEYGEEVDPVGENLINVSRIIKPMVLPSVSITAACDVNNPLYGENGAAYVFAPQKGADEESVQKLDLGLRHISKIINRDIGIDVSGISGAGAAGGLGAGAMAFLNAELKSGIDIVLDTLNFDELLKNTDLVITGEGKIDYQSSHGKVISGICSRANKKNVPVFAICGCTDGSANLGELGIMKLFVTSEVGLPLETLKKEAKERLYKASLEMTENFIF
ncbi:MAG: glycerate kinase [Oscillospiraceae bacterium]|nr:glycerate kinase [Oscillospiraceae bacterium]